MVTASLEFEWGSNGRAGRRTHLSGAAARSYQVTPAGPSHPATAIRMQASPRTSGREPKSQSPDGKDPTTATSAAPTSLTLSRSYGPAGQSGHEGVQRGRGAVYGAGVDPLELLITNDFLRVLDLLGVFIMGVAAGALRSEERRVGKERGNGW